MIRVILSALGLIAFTSFSAHAESWGDAGSMSSVYTEQDKDAFVKICFDNRLSSTPNVRTFSLSYNDVIFHIEIDHGHGKEPDIMTVKPSSWLISSPPSISVEEDSIGCVFITEQLIG